VCARVTIYFPLYLTLAVTFIHRFNEIASPEQGGASASPEEDSFDNDTRSEASRGTPPLGVQRQIITASPGNDLHYNASQHSQDRCLIGNTSLWNEQEGSPIVSTEQTTQTLSPNAQNVAPTDPWVQTHLNQSLSVDPTSEGISSINDVSWKETNDASCLFPLKHEHAALVKYFFRTLASWVRAQVPSQAVFL
jgi:hypothetical protein